MKFDKLIVELIQRSFEKKEIKLMSIVWNCLSKNSVYKVPLLIYSFVSVKNKVKYQAEIIVNISNKQLDVDSIAGAIFFELGRLHGHRKVRYKK